VTGTPSAATALSAADEAAISDDEQELAELKDMWNQREISTREYRQMRKTVEDRITTLQRKGTVNLLKLSGGTGMAGSGGSVCGARVRPLWLCR
jgi:RecA-family ATPase